MGKKLSIGVSAVSHKGKKMSIGVNDVAHKVKKAWIGDASGKARIFWSSGGDKYFFAHSLLSGTINCSSFGDVSLGDLILSSFSGNYSPMYCCCVDGKYYVFVGVSFSLSSGASSYAACGYFYSTDLSQWTYVAFPSTLYTSDNIRKVHAVKYMNGRFVAMVSVKNTPYYGAYSLYAYESTDAITWTENGKIGGQTYDAAITEMQYGNVAGAKGYFVAIENSSNSAEFYSRDLITWTSISNNSRTMYGSCIDQNGDIVELIMEKGTGANNLYYFNLNNTNEYGNPIGASLYCSWGDSTRPAGGVIPVGTNGLAYIGHTSQSYTYKVVRFRDATADTVMSSFSGFLVPNSRIALIKGVYYFIYASSLTGQGGSPKNVNIRSSNDLINWTDKVFTTEGLKACTPVAFEENE